MLCSMKRSSLMRPVSSSSLNGARRRRVSSVVTWLCAARACAAGVKSKCSRTLPMSKR